MSDIGPSATFGNVRVQSEMRGITDIGYRAEFNGRVGEQLKAQYDVAEPIPHRLAELLKRLAQLELLKEITQLMDEPDSKGGKS
jgi:hypothetical protein